LLSAVGVAAGYRLGIDQRCNAELVERIGERGRRYHRFHRRRHDGRGGLIPDEIPEGVLKDQPEIAVRPHYATASTI
jgi:hypothetical protein